MRTLRRDDPVTRLSCLTYTVTEAAVLLGISRAKAYECARTGELPVLRFGRRLVVPAVALADLLDGPPLRSATTT